jgi:hypothetical protein
MDGVCFGRIGWIENMKLPKAGWSRKGNVKPGSFVPAKGMKEVFYLRIRMEASERNQNRTWP